MEIELNKKCYSCHNMIELKEFNKSKNSKDGLQGICRKCEKEYRDKNKQKNRAYQADYRDLYKEKRLNYQTEYRKTSIEYQKQYQADFRKRNPNYQKEYRKRNKAKFYKYFSEKYKFSSTIINQRTYVTVILRPKILIRDNNCCVLCNSIKNLIIHHIIPVKIDIKEIVNMNNLVTLCRECHINKAHAGHFRKYDPEIVIILQQYIISLI